MPSAGPNFPTAATGNTNTIGGGTIAWTSPTNIEVSDSVFATNTLTTTATSDDLIGTGFGFAIIGTDTINGILLEVNHKSNLVSTITESDVRLLKAGAGAGASRSTGASLPAAAATVSYGSAADLWGTTWTPTDINNVNFGAAVSYNNPSGSSRVVSVDFMRITVTSTSAGGATNTAKMMVMF